MKLVSRPQIYLRVYLKILEQRSLKSTDYGSCTISGIDQKRPTQGRWRYLTAKEIQFLKMIS